MGTMSSNKPFPQIAIGYCHPSTIDAAFHTSLTLTLMRDKGVGNQIDSVIGVQSGPRIATARNDIVRAFLALPRKPEWLFMLDSDMVFPPDILEQVTPFLNPTSGIKVLSGLAFIYSLTGQIKPNIMVLGGENNLPQTVWDYPTNKLCKVDAIGAAFFFCHRTVFEDLHKKYGDTPHPWFQESVWQGHEVGEDVTFSLRVREAGHDIHVHTGIVPGHMKHTVIDEESYVAFKAAIDNRGADAVRNEALSRRHLAKRAT